MSKGIAALALSSALAALALAAFNASSAFAKTPAFEVCKLVPKGLRGLWNSRECEGSSVENGEWAWSWPENFGSSTEYCVLGGKEYAEALCEEHDSTGPFLIHLINEQFPRIYALFLLSLLHTTIAGDKLLLHCKHGSAEGQPLTEQLFSGIVLEYTGCEVTKPGTAGELCTVTGPPGEPAGIIKTAALDGHLLGLDEIDLSPEKGIELVKLEFKNKGTESCVLGNEFTAEVTGYQNCLFAHGIENSALDHLLECKASGSHLEFGKESATYEGVAHIHILGYLGWKIILYELRT